MKKCTKCGEIKPLSDFYVHHFTKDGHRASCKLCWITMTKKYRATHYEFCRTNERKWYLNNKEINRKASALWRKNNPDRTRLLAKKYTIKKRATIRGKLEHCISSAINSSLKKSTKARRSWETLVGYTVDQLKRHLEKKFKDGMTWSNYGKNGWEIDHKIPLSAFNFEKPEDIDFKRCWALSNLQPLWAIDNIRKFNKLDKPFQPSLRMSI
jgi:hypothetical protein